MLEFSPVFPARPSCILLIGAHCDDIEIGCGGALLRLVRRFPDARFVCVTLSSDPARAAEARAAEARLLTGAANAEMHVESFPGSYFPYQGAAIKDYFEGLKACKPDLVFTHTRDDRHQDHRVTNELTWNTFRNHAILEYEIPKFDGDLAAPNTFIALTADELREKCAVLLDCFPSQRSRAWFTTDTFSALARLRGVECNAPEGFAEAFYARKVVLGL